MKTNIAALFACCILGCWQYTHAAQPSGYVIEWGWNTSTGNAAPAKQVVDNALVVSIGRLHCLALKRDGTVIQWGGNFRGEASFDNTLLTTGEGGFTDQGGLHITNTNATKIMTNGVVELDGKILSDLVSVAAGDGFSLGLKRDGTVISWGENSVPNCPSNVVAIAAASFASLALKIDGTVIQWMNAKWSSVNGQMSEAAGLSNVVAVAIGKTYRGTRNIALKNDGTVIQWGGELTDRPETSPVSLSNVVAIAAGKRHTLAVRRDGTVIGWGLNDVGQATGVPTKDAPYISNGQVMHGGQILSNVVSVAANDNYSMALKKDGTVVAWGKMVNNQYPANVPDGLSNVVAIAAGDNFCLAITTNSVAARKF